jgi:hypothetical protein
MTTYFGSDGSTIEQYRRQRRLLMIVSLALVFYMASQLQLEYINILGTEMKLQNPDAVLVALWIAWAYFLIRFIGYWNEIDKGIKFTYINALHDGAEKSVSKRSGVLERPERISSDSNLLTFRVPNTTNFDEYGDPLSEDRVETVNGFELRYCKIKSILKVIL